MIPKSVIEKAIAGGWYPKNKFGKYFLRWLEVTAIEDERVYFAGNLDVPNKSPTPRETLALSISKIALDPDFFVALGKEMGWEQSNDKYAAGRGELENYKYHAHRFYDLILRKASQEKINAYWQSLATQPDSTEPLTVKGETS